MFRAATSMTSTVTSYAILSAASSPLDETDVRSLLLGSLAALLPAQSRPPLLRQELHRPSASRGDDGLPALQRRRHSPRHQRDGPQRANTPAEAPGYPAAHRPLRPRSAPHRPLPDPG